MQKSSFDGYCLSESLSSASMQVKRCITSCVSRRPLDEASCPPPSRVFSRRNPSWPMAPLLLLSFGCKAPKAAPLARPSAHSFRRARAPSSITHRAGAHTHTADARLLFIQAGRDHPIHPLASPPSSSSSSRSLLPVFYALRRLGFGGPDQRRQDGPKNSELRATEEPGCAAIMFLLARRGPLEM